MLVYMVSSIVIVSMVVANTIIFISIRHAYMHGLLPGCIPCNSQGLTVYSFSGITSDESHAGIGVMQNVWEDGKLLETLSSQYVSINL